MRGMLVKFVKKHRRLYNLAKKVNRRLNRLSPKKIYSVDRYYYYTYTLKELNELELIKEHYNKIKKINTKLLVIIDNPSIACKITKLISENTDVLFTDLGYYQRYEKGFSMDKIILLDYHLDAHGVLDYIK